MSINTDFYGSVYYTLPNTSDGIKTANFSGAASPDITASALQYAINAGKYSAGTLIDISASPSGIPGTLDGHEYNTLYDYGAVNCRLTNEDCILNRSIVSSIPLLWRCRYRNSDNASTDVMFNVYDSTVLNAPGRFDTWDLYRYNAIVSMDFKKFMMCVVVCAFDGTITDTGNDIYTGSVTRYIYMDLDTYLSNQERYDSNTKTAREYYPYISQILLIPATGGSFTTFSLRVGIDNSLGCIPNKLYDFAISQISNSIPQDTNTPNAVITSAVSYMDGEPFSGGSVYYTNVEDNYYNFISIPSGVYSYFMLLGMQGGNGTSNGIVNPAYTGTNKQGVLRGIRGKSHIKVVRTALTDNVYAGFGYWYDMPDQPAEIKDAVLKMCSYLGCIISTSVSSTDLNSSSRKRYIGILSDAGIATGTYEEITAETLEDYPQTSTNDFIEDTPYDPAAEPDPNTYSDTTILRPRVFKTANCFNSVYAVSADIYMLKYYLYDVVAPTATEDSNRQKFLNANPIDCIVNLMFYPFNLHDYITGNYNPVKLGNQTVIFTIGQTTYSFYGLQPDASDSMQVLLDMGSVVYYPHFGDFRDYEPYSSAELIIPYHGSLTISPAEYMGHKIGVKCIVDLSTGASIAYIFRDDLAVDSITGTVGVQIPVSGIAQADYNNSVFNASAQLNAAKISAAAGFASDTIGLVASAVSANPLGVAASVTKIAADTAAASNNLDIAQYNVSHVKIPYRQSGTSTPATSTAADQIARLIVRRPKMLEYDPQIYAEVNGYACLICDTLSGYTGFTVCSDVHVGGGATAEEKNMIKSLLQAGVYL